MGWLIAACGLFAVCGAWFDWDFFMTDHRARLFVNLFGRRGARIFYGLLGTALTVLGVLVATGVIQNAK